METHSYKVGDLVRARWHGIEGLDVLKGELGRIVHWPTADAAAEYAPVYLCVEFDVGRNINGRFGPKCGVAKPGHLAPAIDNDPDYYEDDV